MKNHISDGTAVLGIEFGSTRIKSVLIDREHKVIASGSHEWENDFRNGVWTYSEDAILSGLQASYADLKQNVLKEIGMTAVRIQFDCKTKIAYTPDQIRHLFIEESASSPV